MCGGKGVIVFAASGGNRHVSISSVSGQSVTLSIAKPTFSITLLCFSHSSSQQVLPTFFSLSLGYDTKKTHEG